jgi:putative tryptophan/tyrosine transport system substrate-binding protein
VKRREFIAGLAAAAWPAVARTQQSAAPVIGVLNGPPSATFAKELAAISAGLKEMGFVDGRNVTLEHRSAESHFDRIPELTAELIGRHPAVIFVGGYTPGVRTVIAATKTIPIVFTTGTDPVAAGLVASLSRPGGNATGFATINGENGSKRLSLVQAILPAATKVALLVNPSNPVTTGEDIQSVASVGQRLGLEIVLVSATNVSELANAYESAVRYQADALVVGSDALFIYTLAEVIAALALKHAIPTVGSTRSLAAAGVLMGYGADELWGFHQAGIYIGRLLKGAKPADLPVQQPTKFDLVINLKTAKTLGLTIPETLLATADEVIQ